MPDSGNMPEPDETEPVALMQLALPVSQKVVLVIDLVESVRLMAADEAGTVARWHDFAQTAQHHTIPAHHGRMVKSLGDGLMVEFENPRDAANAAHGLHAVMHKGNAGQSAERQMHLRAGINATHVYTDNNDIYGAGVNLAARIATLAGPGETVVTAQVRDGLTDGLDAAIEDLGECYLKHIDEPVRCYRIGNTTPTKWRSVWTSPVASLKPTIVVIPFSSRSAGDMQFAIGELIAEGIIARLSRSADLRVISYLSSVALRDRTEALTIAQEHLGAQYILAGSFTSNGQSLSVMAELSDTRQQVVLATQQHRVLIADLLDPDSEVIQSLSQAAHDSLLRREIERALTMPLPSLESCTLLFGAINLMHRMSRTDFERSRLMLDHLIERHPRISAPRAWLAKWHSLNFAQSWSSDAKRDTQMAISALDQALNLDGSNALALSVRGIVQGYMQKQFDKAQDSYEMALTANPNEPLAWIGMATLNTWSGHQEEAIRCAESALALSPIDPMRYYFDSLAATTLLAGEKYDRAIELADRSLRANRLFSSTGKTLVLAYMMKGQLEAARNHAKRLLAIEPKFSVAAFRQQSPMYRSAHGEKYAEAYANAGIPLS